MWLLSRGGAAVPLFLYLLHSVSGGYIITWPKVWFPDTPVQFCFAPGGFPIESDEITVQVSVRKSQVEYPSYPSFDHAGGAAYLPQEVIKKLGLQPETMEVILEKQLRPILGAKHSCVPLLPPPGIAGSYQIEVRVYGTLRGVAIDETRNIAAQNVYQTIIQTDKEQYKPGQKVQFRVLTLKTPNMRVATNPTHGEACSMKILPAWAPLPARALLLGLVHGKALPKTASHESLGIRPSHMLL